MRPEQLLIATHNAGKLTEFRQILQGHFVAITSAGELNLPEPEETGTTFVENALLKAKAAAQAANCLTLADDSGLCVNRLNGDPGLYSARWAGPQKDFAAAMRRVHQALGDNPDRSAYLIAVLALVWPDGRQEIFEGRIEGTLVWPPRGTGGHGYDPMFQPLGETRTFAEMPAAAKDMISHRGRAVRLLLAKLPELA